MATQLLDNTCKHAQIYDTFISEHRFQLMLTRCLCSLGRNRFLMFPWKSLYASSFGSPGISKPCIANLGLPIRTTRAQKASCEGRTERGQAESCLLLKMYPTKEHNSCVCVFRMSMASFTRIHAPRLRFDHLSQRVYNQTLLVTKQIARKASKELLQPLSGTLRYSCARTQSFTL